jgi:flavin reductase (DIM6/NTAB) family NADH-FMN oxidoreductase RutF
MLDPDADLTERLQETGRGVVQLLAWEHRDLADAFAGVTPAPGGPFTLAEFADTDHGPRLVGAGSWASVELESTRPVGWSLEVVATVAELAVGDDAVPLVHRRGRYLRP